MIEARKERRRQRQRMAVTAFNAFTMLPHSCDITIDTLKSSIVFPSMMRFGCSHNIFTVAVAVAAIAAVPVAAHNCTTRTTVYKQIYTQTHTHTHIHWHTHHLYNQSMWSFAFHIAHYINAMHEVVLPSIAKQTFYHQEVCSGVTF